MRLATLAFALLLALPATAQTRYEWVGGASGDWTDAANWSPAGVPAAADTAVVGTPTGGILVTTLTEDTTVGGLEVAGLGAVTGDADLTVTDRFLWTGGGAGFDAFRGTGTITVASGATLHLAEGAARFQMSAGRMLVNDGTVMWDGPGAWQGQGRLVNNGEVILAMGDTGTSGFFFSSLVDGFTNSATGVIRRTGDGNALLSAGLVNDGLVRVENGSIELGGFNLTGTTGAGAVEITAGAELIASGGNHTFASITGAAFSKMERHVVTVTDLYDVETTRVEGGELAVDAAGDAGDLILTGGALGGSGTVTVTGSMDWTGGTMAGSGTTVLGPTIPLTIGGDATISLGGSRTLRTEGPVTWTGDADLSAGSSDTVFENAGTLTSSGDGERRTNFITVLNTGTIVHDGGALRFDSPMENAGVIQIESGTLGLQFNARGTDTGRYEIGAAGRMEVATPSRTFAEGSEVVGTGTFAFTSGFENRATWRPGASPGTLTIDSIWPTPAPEAVLDIEIGGPTAGTDFDQVVVSREAALGGTLRVTLLDGYTPSDGDRFQIITATNGASGAFDAIELPDGLEAYVDATAEGAALVIGTPVSSEPGGPAAPDALALSIAPNPAAGAVALGVALPEAGTVRVSVVDALGREVAVPLDRALAPGEHTASVDTSALAPGVYVVRLGAGVEAVTRMLTVVR